MDFTDQVRKFIADSAWDELTDFLEKQVENIDTNFHSSSLMNEESNAYAKKQLADIDALTQLINEQKKEVEQQLLSLKRSRTASKVYLSDDK